MRSYWIIRISIIMLCIFSLVGCSSKEVNTKKEIENALGIRREFGRSFVNYLGKAYEDDVMKYKELYTPIIIKMANRGYGNWQSCVNEHVLRAITIQKAFNNSQDEGERALLIEKSKGFIYIEGLISKLEEYEKNRDRYPTFEVFYPELLNVFEEYRKNMDKNIAYYTNEKFKFSVQYPKNWHTQIAPMEEATTEYEASPDEGIKIYIEDRKNDYLYVFGQHGHISIGENSYEKEKFITKEGLEGNLYKENEKIKYLVLDSGLHGAYINISHKVYREFEQQIINILKSIEIVD